jgi:hypothetical protein
LKNAFLKVFSMSLPAIQGPIQAIGGNWLPYQADVQPAGDNFHFGATLRTGAIAPSVRGSSCELLAARRHHPHPSGKARRQTSTPPQAQQDVHGIKRSSLLVAPESIDGSSSGKTS